MFSSMLTRSSTIEMLLKAAMLKTVKISPGMSVKNGELFLFVGPKIIQNIEAYGMKRSKNNTDHFRKSFNIGAIEATNGPGPGEEIYGCQNQSGIRVEVRIILKRICQAIKTLTLVTFSHIISISRSFIYIYIYIRKTNLKLLHKNFIHYKFVSYGKRSLPHLSGEYRVIFWY